MPEPGLTDLDAAFADLTRDFARVSRPGDPRAAMRASRQRAWARAGVAGAAAVTVGAAAIWALPTSSDGGEDPLTATDAPTVLPMPAPANLTPEALDQATAGWQEGWQWNDGADPVWFECDHDFENGDLPKSATKEDEIYFKLGPDQEFNTIATGFADAGLASEAGSTVLDILSSCGGAAGPSSTTTFGPPGAGSAEVTSFPITYDDRERTIFMATVGTEVEIAVLTAGADLPADTLTRLHTALVADLLAPSSYEDGSVTVTE